MAYNTNVQVRREDARACRHRHRNAIAHAVGTRTARGAGTQLSEPNGDTSRESEGIGPERETGARLADAERAGNRGANRGAAGPRSGIARCEIDVRGHP